MTHPARAIFDPKSLKIQIFLRFRPLLAVKVLRTKMSPARNFATGAPEEQKCSYTQENSREIVVETLRARDCPGESPVKPGPNEKVSRATEFPAPCT